MFMNVLMQEHYDLNRFLDVANFTITPLVVQLSCRLLFQTASFKVFSSYFLIEILT
jgi:hypothetical protein